MLEFISRTKLRNNTEELPFRIVGTSTETKNYFRVNLVVDSNIDFLMEIDRYSCD